MSRLTICLTNKCNLNCLYCFADKDNSDNPLKLDRVKEFIIKLHRKEKIEEIYLTGGEPLLYPDIEEIICFCTSFTKKIILLTNGILLRQNIMHMLNEYGAYLHVSLDSMNKTYHNKYRGGHNIIIQNLLELKKYTNIKVNINVTLSPININEIPFIESFVEEMGFTSDYSLLTSNSSVENSWDNVSQETINLMIKELKLWGEKNNNTKVIFFEYILKKGISNVKSCYYCKNNIVIHSNGEAYACFNNNRLYFGNILEGKINNVVDKYYQMNVNELYEGCFSFKCIGTFL